MPRIHVFLGTKAEYIKTAPLLRLMDARGVDYHLIDAGQHAVLGALYRRELGVRDPDVVLGPAHDVDTVGQALRWASGLAAKLPRKDKVLREVFGGDGGICVVHGDTPSTFLSTLLARRAGLTTAHLEAGLRSHRLLHPFPEELIRLAVMRLSDVLFAPDAVTVDNLRALKVKGTVVPVVANTVVEALRYSLPDPPEPGSGPVVVTMHRVENLKSTSRTDGLVALVRRVAQTHDVVFVQHGPTIDTFTSRGLDPLLHEVGVRTTPLLPHAEFTRMLAAAPFAISDGGSIQEESALLGLPLLVWREATEREDGLGANVLLARYDPATVDAFLADPQAWRRPPAPQDLTPSEQVLDVLLERLALLRR